MLSWMREGSSHPRTAHALRHQTVSGQWIRGSPHHQDPVTTGLMRLRRLVLKEDMEDIKEFKVTMLMTWVKTSLEQGRTLEVLGPQEERCIHPRRSQTLFLFLLLVSPLYLHKRRWARLWLRQHWDKPRKKEQEGLGSNTVVSAGTLLEGGCHPPVHLALGVVHYIQPHLIYPSSVLPDRRHRQ